MTELESDVHCDLPDDQSGSELVHAHVSARIHCGAILLRHRYGPTHHLYILLRISVVVVLCGGDGQGPGVCVFQCRGLFPAQHRPVCQAQGGHHWGQRYVHTYIFVYTYSIVYLYIHVCRCGHSRGLSQRQLLRTGDLPLDQCECVLDLADNDPVQPGRVDLPYRDPAVGSEDLQRTDRHRCGVLLHYFPQPGSGQVSTTSIAILHGCSRNECMYVCMYGCLFVYICRTWLYNGDGAALCGSAAGNILYGVSITEANSDGLGRHTLLAPPHY